LNDRRRRRFIQSNGGEGKRLGIMIMTEAGGRLMQQLCVREREREKERERERERERGRAGERASERERESERGREREKEERERERESCMMYYCIYGLR
jgi:hypothetical protein